MNKFRQSGKSMNIEVDGGTIKIQLKDGENISKKRVKRGYLRGEEMNHYIMIYTVCQMMEGVRTIEGRASDPMWETWERSGILTKEQKKNLKTAHTFLTKFLGNVFENNLDVKTKDEIVKRVSKWNVKVVDDHMLKKINRMLETADKFAIDREMFFELSSYAIEKQCLNCTKERCECSLNTFLHDNLIPPPTGYGDVKNCEYAWTDEDSEKPISNMEIVSANEFWDCILKLKEEEREIKEKKFGNNIVYVENGRKIAEFTTQSGPRLRTDIYQAFMGQKA